MSCARCELAALRGSAGCEGRCDSDGTSGVAGHSGWPRRDAGSRVPADAAALFSFKFVTPAARCSSQVAALARRPGPARGRRTVTHDPATTVTVTVTCQWPGPGRVPPTAGVSDGRPPLRPGRRRVPGRARRPGRRRAAREVGPMPT